MVVALLATDFESVAADGRADGWRAGTPPPRFYLTSRGAAIARSSVMVVALLATDFESVAADGRADGWRAGAVPACFLLTARRTPVSRCRIALVALLARLHDAITAARGGDEDAPAPKPGDQDQHLRPLAGSHTHLLELGLGSVGAQCGAAGGRLSRKKVVQSERTLWISKQWVLT